MNKKITFTQALLTAVGMVIGSGIFFRADDILKYTDGNVTIAILGWILLGGTLIFAGISVSVVARYSTSEGGSIGYLNDVFGKVPGFLAGWFETSIYTPTLVGILGIVGARFLVQLFGYQLDSVSPMIVHTIGLGLIIMTFTWNFLSTKFAALFSSSATVIKLFPIVIIGLVGMYNIDTSIIVEDAKNFNFTLFTAPLLSMGFAFNGWITAATLARDLEHPQRDIAKILALNAVIVTIAYILYFTGITMLMDSQEIISLGDGHVAAIANQLLGGLGEKLILFCVFISIMGTLNGKIMGGFRYPHALAQAGDLPNSKFFVVESKRGTQARAALISLVLVFIWYALYTTQAYAQMNATPEALEAGSYLFGGITFDDIPIMGVSFEAIALMLASVKLRKVTGQSFFKTIIASIIGIVGQMYIVVSFLQTNNAAILYMFISVLIILTGLAFRYQARKKIV